MKCLLTYQVCSYQIEREVHHKISQLHTLVGRSVVVQGLVTKPELNGRTGSVVSFDYDKGRYSVELDDDASSFMIKPCNLLLTGVYCGYMYLFFTYAYMAKALLMYSFYCRLSPSRPNLNICQ